MYILQLSDLHISDQTDIVLVKEKFQRLTPIINDIIPKNSDLLCCFLGDFCDMGNPDTFELIRECLAELMESLRVTLNTCNIEYELVPGNHDLCQSTDNNLNKDMSHFNQFASKLLDRDIAFSDNLSIFQSEHFNHHFILINTTHSTSHEYGIIDFPRLESLTIVPGSIVLTHHGPVSSDENDTAAIRNGYRLHHFLEKHNCTAFLHGHTHGYKRYTLGNDCQVIGVGPFLKNEGKYDISNQCNLIKITGDSVREVKTLTYQGDRKTWDAVHTYIKSEDNNYLGSDVYALYSRILKAANENNLLPNLRIQIQTSFDNYKSSITENFALFKNDAIMWQNPEGDPHLELTHGQQMNVSDMNWQDFVINSLKINPTSKRVIIPLINREIAFHSQDDKYLVSFDVLQLGFMSSSCNTLYMTVYMRALEIRHFLPINLYEIYLISEEIKKAFPSIEHLNICIFAFQAEVKKNYGCLRKSEIDLIRTGQLCRLICDKDYKSISKMLKQKINMGDTLIDTAWLLKLQEAFEDCYIAENQQNVITLILNVLSKLNNLKEIRTHNSSYLNSQESEEQYHIAMEALIHQLELLS